MSTILTIIAVAIAGLLLYATTRPGSFHVSRSVTMSATPDAIFPYFNELKRNLDWSPYETRDPAMARTFTGPAAGPGAVYEFAGNNKVGAGRIEILETQAPTKVVMKLDMIKPIEGHNVVTYTLEPKDGATNVTWTMDGNSPFIAKLMGIFLDMDKMIGRDFETGLATLKTRVEQPRLAAQ